MLWNVGTCFRVELPRRFKQPAGKQQQYPNEHCHQRGENQERDHYIKSAPTAPIAAHSLPDPNYRHHSSSLPELCPMREEASAVARGAAFDHADVFVTNSGILQLALVGFDQVEMDFGPEFAVAGSSLVQEQQWVTHMDRVGVEDLLKEFVSVGELRLKFRSHLGTDLIAALPDGRPNDSTQITWHTPELPPHFADAFLDHPGDSPAPACMECTDGTALHVGDQNRNTIGGLDGQQQTRGIGNQPVARKWLTRSSVNLMHERRMDLLELHQRPGTSVVPGCSHRLQKQCAIALDVLQRVMLGQAEIEGVAAVAGRNAALPGAESVHQPGKLRQKLGAQDFHRLDRLNW